MKWLITSDIHIHEYADYNLFNDKDYRLNQFLNLAHRLVDIADKEKCEILVVPGDLIHRSIISSAVGHCLYEFFQILGKRFDKDHLLFILGQHDKNSKSNTTTEKDSIVHVIAQNATYMNGKIIEIDGKTIAFKDWTPDANFSFIENQVDVLIGHLTLSNMFGQEYDDTKYKLGFFGDIHTRSSFGHSHTINVPIQHYISDSTEGSVVILDTEDLSWKRVNTENEEYKFLKIYYEDDPKFNAEDPYSVSVKRVGKVLNKEHIHRDINLEEVIKNVVISSGFEELHKDIFEKIDKTGCDPINMDFKLNNIQITDFRSIKEFYYNFDSRFTAITGKNGSGKSSFIRAIDYILRPTKTAKNLANDYNGEMSVILDLDYNGLNHIIERGIRNDSGYLVYKINGEEIQSNNISDKNNIITNNLQFMKHIDILIRKQNAPPLLGQYSYADRIGLINSLFGLSLIDRIYNFSNSLLKTKKSILDSELLLVEKLKGIVEANEDDFTQVENLSKVELELDEAQEDLKQIKMKIQNNNKKKELLLVIENKESNLINFTYDEELVNKDSSQLIKETEQGESLKTHFKNQLEIVRKSKTSSEVSINLLKSKIEETKAKLNEVITICPSCKQDLKEIDIEKIKEHINGDIKECEQKISELTKLSEEADYDNKIATLQNDISEIEKILRSLVVNITTIQSEKEKKTKKENLQKEIDKLKLELSNFMESVEIWEDQESLSLRQELVEKGIVCLQSSLTSIKILQQKELKYKESVSNLNQKNSEIESIREEIIKLSDYVKLFHSTGSVVKSVYLEVSKILTDDNVIVRTIKTLASGEERIDFDIDLRVGNKIYPYDDLSGGQQVYVDMYFLSKLFKMSGSVGALILDETLKDLDIEMLETVSKIINESPINNILLSTHVESFNNYDSKMKMKLVENKTEVVLEGK